nr:hypothetical protein [Klebsiella pneumoniae subsp. pneumoniae]
MVDKGVTVMVTTHFMDEAEYCDRIGLVYHGKLIASGTPDALKAQAADDSQTDPTMEQAFITLINRWDKENSHGRSILSGGESAPCASKRPGRLCAIPAVG